MKDVIKLIDNGDAEEKIVVSAECSLLKIKEKQISSRRRMRKRRNRYLSASVSSSNGARGSLFSLLF